MGTQGDREDYTRGHSGLDKRASGSRQSSAFRACEELQLLILSVCQKKEQLQEREEGRTV